MKAWDIVKLGLVLMIYAAAACVGLAFVYTGTAKTIEERTAADLENALKELFPGADSFEEITGAIQSPDPAVSFESAYAVKKGGKLTGAAIRAVGGSYGGPIKILVGINADGTISRIKIMEHSDTPGLGANAADPGYYVNEEKKITFYGQFDGKALSDPFEAKNDVIAITASTITSRSVSVLVKTTGMAAEAWLTAQGAGK
jgi:electron transport complex protein RnfG